jgi:hypothetical protein
MSHLDNLVYKIFQEEKKIRDMSIKYLNEMIATILAKNQELVELKYNIKKI